MIYRRIVKMISWHFSPLNYDNVLIYTRIIYDGDSQTYWTVVNFTLSSPDNNTLNVYKIKVLDLLNYVIK